MASNPMACPAPPTNSSGHATVIDGRVTRVFAGITMTDPSTVTVPPDSGLVVLSSVIPLINPIDVNGLGSYGGVKDMERPKKAKTKRTTEKLNFNISKDNNDVFPKRSLGV